MIEDIFDDKVVYLQELNQIVEVNIEDCFKS